MNYDRMTTKAREAVQQASAHVLKSNQSNLTPWHLLLSLLEQENGMVPVIFTHLGIDIDGKISEINDRIAKFPKVYGESAQIQMDQATARVLAVAEEQAGQLNDEYVSTEHFLLAMLSIGAEAGKWLRGLGLDREGLIRTIREVRGNRRVSDEKSRE
jgi:ATP-dependent Clp protease ATP-binding subunit ClpB